MILAEKSPDETFAICRTSSIGAIVPPPVTTTFIAGRFSPLHPRTLHDGRQADSLAGAGPFLKPERGHPGPRDEPNR